MSTKYLLVSNDSQATWTKHYKGEMLGWLLLYKKSVSSRALSKPWRQFLLAPRLPRFPFLFGKNLFKVFGGFLLLRRLTGKQVRKLKRLSFALRREMSKTVKHLKWMSRSGWRNLAEGCWRRQPALIYQHQRDDGWSRFKWVQLNFYNNCLVILNESSEPNQQRKTIFCLSAI